MYFAADGKFLGQSIKGGSEIKIATNYTVFQQRDKSGNMKTMYKIAASKSIDQFDVKTAGKVYQTIYDKEIKGKSTGVIAYKDDTNFGEGGFTDTETKKISINMENEHGKLENGKYEKLNNDYNNVVNTLFYEDMHVQGISDSGFEHFKIWDAQTSQKSYINSTPLFKDYLKNIGSNYISSMETNIKQLVNNEMKFPERVRKESLKAYYGEYLKNVKTYNKKTGSNYSAKKLTEIK